MAVIHHTTLKPTKLELLTAWLPTRPWYAGGSGVPELAKAGGFRLDDPAGEVGVEFLVVTDAAAPEPTSYLVPLTYRGAPLEGADGALVGTMEHGVLGKRWAYDGFHDPVLVAQMLALIEGRVEAQDQNTTDAPDPEVSGSYAGSFAGHSDITAVDDHEGTELRGLHDAILRVHRVLRPVADGSPRPPQEATGHLTGHWKAPDGTAVRGLFAVLRRPPGQA